MVHRIYHFSPTSLLHNAILFCVCACILAHRILKMNGTEAKASIAKLNHNNYQLWKFKLEMILARDDLWEIVHEDTPAAPDTTWSKRNRQAMATISLAVEDSQLIHIRKCDTGKGMWEALKNLYERPNLNSKLYLLRKLYKIRLENHQSMTAHLNDMLEIVEQLRGLGEELKEDHVAALILCSLPESYGPLITALEGRAASELTLELIKGKLLDEFHRRKENYGHENSMRESALKVDHSHDRYKGRRETRECFHCKKPGHLKRDCRALKAQIRSGQRVRSPHRVKAATKEISRNYKDTDSKNPEREEDENYCFFTSEGHRANEWYVDSGATSHMTSERDFFTKLSLYPKPEKVLLADGSHIEVEGVGSGTLLNEFDKDAQEIIIKDVLYVPKLEGSLISVKKLAELGFEISFKGPTCTIKKGKLLVTANLDKQLYKLKYSHKSFMVRDALHDDCIHIWHRRFGHRDPTAIRRLEKEVMTRSLNISNCTQIKTCEECIKGKMTIKPFPKRSENHASKPYEILHSDVCGPMKTTSLSGKRYVATIIDDFSGYTEIFLLKTKNEVNQNLFEYFKKWNNFFQRKPTIIRTDGGGEYINQELNSYLKQNGIQRQISTPYTPQQNGTAERKNRYLMDMTRCMLLDANLSNTYWGEAINTAAYLQNRIPHRLQTKTPYELWYKRKPNIDHLRVFGCKAFTRIPSEKLTKLDDRAESGIMMGYSKFSKGYRILQPHTGKIIISRNVIFDESPHTTTLAQNHQNMEQSHSDDNQEKGEDNQHEIIIMNPELQKPQEPGPKIEKETTPIPQRRSERINKGIPAKRYACKGQVTSEYEPQKWSDIVLLNGTEKEKWLQAIEEEMKSFRDNDAWKLVTPPAGKNIVGCKWTFKVKYNSEGMITQHKARLVAKGYSQKAGEDFTETYAPVVRYSTIRTLLVITSSRRMYTRHLDVKCAFLNGELSEELYMEQPEGQVIKGQEGMVCKLKRCIYGLKQSANAWNQRINEILTSKGYNRGTADQCLYTRMRDKAMTYILLYVDDLLICSDDQNHITDMRQELEKLFEMKDLGTVTYYLGIHIQKQRDGSFLINQSNKLRSLASRFGLEDAKDASSPMESDYLKLKNDQKLLPNQNQYREAVGALLYVSTVTRPDIAAAANFLGRKVAQPNQADWTAVKRVIRYLKSTAEMGIILGGDKNLTLTGYVDADWAGDCQDRKSTSGFTFHLDKSLITWSSRKQSCVAMSSTEAEYVAAAAACQEIKWLQQLLIDFNHPQKGPITLYEDNQGCIKLASSDGFHARTKHIDVKYHILKHFQDQQIIKLEYCPTNMMLADMFTKPLGRDRFLELREKLRVMTPTC